MRTLAVMHLADITGPARSLYPRLSALAQRGQLDVLVAATGPVAQLYGDVGTVAVCPFAALTHPSSPRAAARATRTFGHDVSVLRAQMRRTQPDVVVVVTTMLPAALLAARLERLRSVVYAAEIFDKPYARSAVRTVARAVLVRFVVSSASAIVCCSDAVARQFGSARDGRVVTIYPGISEAKHSYDGGLARRRFGVPENALCLAVVGSISEGRGQDLVIRSLPQILKARPDAFCLVAGAPHPRDADLSYRERLDRIARALGVRERLGFTGFVDPIDELYAASDVVINPARVNEAFGRVALEALAAGKPVVAARVGAIPEVLVHEEHALLVKPNDPQAITQAILRLASDEDLRIRLVTAGQALVRRDFSEQAGVDAFGRVIDGVLARSDLVSLVSEPKP